MILNNTYIIRRKSLRKLLDNTEKFIDKMRKFKEIHSDYSYSINIIYDKLEDDWIVEINIKNKNEQEDVSTSETSFRSRDVL